MLTAPRHSDFQSITIATRFTNPRVIGAKWQLPSGVDHPDPQGGMSFPDSASFLEATAQGFGIGFISRADAMEGIANGRLIAPLGEAVLADMPADMVPGFYLVYSGDNLKLDQVRVFCEWLGEQQWDEIEQSSVTTKTIISTSASRIK